MPKVTYVLRDSVSRILDLRLGQSVMHGAWNNGSPGILAECGGNCMCGTCHVYIEAMAEALPRIAMNESDMLDETAAGRKSNSRLSCQIKMTDALDGLVVRIAECQ
jgi:ferredoxin, 2Fe-2S